MATPLLLAGSKENYKAREVTVGGRTGVGLYYQASNNSEDLVALIQGRAANGLLASNESLNPASVILL